jgi:S-formylglutathione hydrolase FrmB
MRNRPLRPLFVLGLVLLAVGPHPSFVVFASRATSVAEHAAFNVRVGAEAARGPVSGRLLVFLARGAQGPQAEDLLGPGFLDPESVFVTSVEVHDAEPGAAIEIASTQLAFPHPLGEVPPGDYRAQAILDADGSYAYSGPGPGDLVSAIVPVTGYDPASSSPVALELARRLPDTTPADTASVKLVTLVSPSLTAFWGRPIEMRAAVVLPYGYDTAPRRRYPTVFHVHGFGGSHLGAWREGLRIVAAQQQGELPPMINVFLDGSCPMGHHEFADSANNGPWGRALTTELIPSLESRFRMDATPRGRLLTGHSSGGWSTLWLMITYPNVFGATWSTSPDPVDFRNFTGPDLTKPETENVYRDSAGRARNLVRYKGRELMSVEQYVLLERVQGDHGGQMQSFDAVFSPKGDDGRPMEMFDRRTGAINPVVAKAWEKYDISKTLRDNWARLGPRLKGRIHIVVGSDDTFHLEQAVYLLRDELRRLGSDATIEVLDGRDHMDLYQGGLGDRIAKEMYAFARRARR